MIWVDMMMNENRCEICGQFIDHHNSKKCIDMIFKAFFPTTDITESYNGKRYWMFGGTFEKQTKDDNHE